MTSPTVAAAVFVVGLAAALPCAAELEAVSDTGFTSTFRSDVAAPPATAWRAYTQLPQWWSDSHTWSGKAKNMTLDLQAGGCWCERWGDGDSARHGVVVWVQPPHGLRVEGALGPLQELAVDGVFTLATRAAADGRTTVELAYRVAGSPEAGLRALAPIVDAVMGQQYQRLLQHIAAVAGATAAIPASAPRR